MNKSKRTDWEVPAAIAALVFGIAAIAWFVESSETEQAKINADLRIKWAQHNTERETKGLERISWEEFNK